MATNPDTISKLQEYAAKVKETDYHLEGADAEPDYGARISRTLQSLQSQVKQHQDALEKVLISHLDCAETSRLTHPATGKSNRTVH